MTASHLLGVHAVAAPVTSPRAPATRVPGPRGAPAPAHGAAEAGHVGAELRAVTAAATRALEILGQLEVPLPGGPAPPGQQIFLA